MPNKPMYKNEKSEFPKHQLKTTHLNQIDITAKNMHFSHLIPLIENIGVSQQEFSDILANSIAYAKETKNPTLLSFGGAFDLLITDVRIHVILITQSFELPEVELVEE